MKILIAAFVFTTVITALPIDKDGNYDLSASSTKPRVRFDRTVLNYAPVDYYDASHRNFIHRLIDSIWNHFFGAQESVSDDDLGEMPKPITTIALLRGNEKSKYLSPPSNRREDVEIYGMKPASYTEDSEENGIVPFKSLDELYADRQEVKPASSEAFPGYDSDVYQDEELPRKPKPSFKVANLHLSRPITYMSSWIPELSPDNYGLPNMDVYPENALLKKQRSNIDLADGYHVDNFGDINDDEHAGEESPQNGTDREGSDPDDYETEDYYDIRY